MTPSTNKKIAIAANAAWNIANFRLGLARALMDAGYEVIAIAPPDEHVSRIEATGLRFVPMPMSREGTNPLQDLGLLRRLFVVLRQERPLAYLGFTIKPNVYGGLACRWLGIASIHNITGLGFVFTGKSVITKVATTLYRWGLGSAHRVFFQNSEDRELAQARRLVPPARTALLPGSGVDTTHFAPSQWTAVRGAPFRFLLCGRVLRDKGVEEYVEASRLLRADGCRAEFQILGPVGDANPTAIGQPQFDQWLREGLIRYLGTTDDVRAAVSAADCIVLPSYHEGMPRSLLEAASMAKPIVTTDVPGCREAVVDGVTGLLCRPRDATDLAAKLRQLMDLPPEQLGAMGRLARERAEREFDERIVVERYLAAIADLH